MGHIHIMKNLYEKQVDNDLLASPKESHPVEVREIDKVEGLSNGTTIAIVLSVLVFLIVVMVSIMYCKGMFEGPRQPSRRSSPRRSHRSSPPPPPQRSRPSSDQHSDSLSDSSLDSLKSQPRDQTPSGPKSQPWYQSQPWDQGQPRDQTPSDPPPQRFRPASHSSSDSLSD